MNRHWPLLLALLILASGTCGATDSVAYDIEAQIAPVSGRLEVSLVLDYVHGGGATGGIAFLLHRNLEIASLTGPGVVGFACRDPDRSEYPFTPEARLVSVDLAQPLPNGERLRIAMEYSGKIGILRDWETNRITTEWVELGMYAPWFPYFPELAETGFDIHLSIDEAYVVAANGFTTREDDGRWRIRADASDNDIVLAASRDMRTRETADQDRSFTLHWTTELEDGTVDDLASLGLSILQRYSGWFGNNEAARGNLLISPRQRGGGYARRNLVVMSAIDDGGYREGKTGYARYIAHELAHLWWNRAAPDTWEDWLNESFAEYSALMFVRELAGDEEFERRMAAKISRISSLPPVRGLERDDENAHGVLYDKGPVLLATLEKRLGRAEFRRLLADVWQGGVSSTEQFLSLLEESSSAETAEYFRGLLVE